MKNTYAGPVPQHEDYAITGEANKAEDFGVKPHNHTDKPFSEPKVHRKAALHDRHRGVKPGATGFHRNPSSPSHGPFGE